MSRYRTTFAPDEPATVLEREAQGEALPQTYRPGGPLRNIKTCRDEDEDETDFQQLESRYP